MTNRKFAVNTTFNVVFKLFGVVIGFVVVPLFVRRLGIELYGVWALAGVVVGYLGLLDLGMSSGAITKYVAGALAMDDQVEMRQVVSTSLVTMAAVGAVICLALVLLAPALVSAFKVSAAQRDSAIHLLRIAGVFSLVTSVVRTGEPVAQGLNEYVPLSVIGGLSAILSSLALLVGVWLGWSIELLFIVSNSIGVMLSALLWWVVVRRYLPYYAFRAGDVSWSCAKRMLKFGAGLVYANVLSMLAYTGDNLILGSVLSAVEVGIYNVISKPFYQLRAIRAMFTGAIRPLIFAADRVNDMALIEDMAVRRSRLLSIAFVPLVVTAIVVCKPFFTLWVGESLARYAVWAQLFLVTQLYAIQQAVVGIIGEGRSKLKALNTFHTVLSLSNFFLSIALTLWLGFPGVIIGTFLTDFLPMPLSFVIYCRIAEVNLRAVVMMTARTLGVFCSLMLLGALAERELDPDTWMSLILFSAGLWTIQMAAAFVLLLTAAERRRVLAVARSLPSRLQQVRISWGVQ